MNAAVKTRLEVQFPIFEESGPGLTDQFKAAFRQHPLGVAVITAAAGDQKVAITVSSVSSVSADPPILVFSASALASSTPILENADTVVVHMLGADQLWLAQLGATSGIDRFADTSLWELLPTGEPTFPAADARILGRVVHRLSLGGSVIYAIYAQEVLLTPEHGGLGSDPLVYHNRRWHRLFEDSVIG
jgi:flavin reductase (DIM6/NTAB) family NADH-FMN oxidoreductase RutF